MAKKKKRYTEEFKQEAVRLLLDRGEQSAADIAISLGVQASQLYDWRKRFHTMTVSAAKGRGEDKDEELHRLRKENALLRKEKEVLKKSVALFIRENER